MDDWGSPWADDAGTTQFSSPRAVVPVESTRSSSNPNLEAQPIGNILTGLKRSSLWVGEEGLGEWANVGGSAAPIIDPFPDWSAEVSTRIPLSQNVEKDGVNIQSEPKPLRGHESGLPLDIAEVEPHWKSGSSHNDYVTPVTKLTPLNGRASVELEPGLCSKRGIGTFSKDNRREGDVDVPQGSLGLQTDQKNDRSTAVADQYTKLPLKGDVEEGYFSSRPSSSPASEKCMEAETVESPRTSLEEEVLLFEERKLRSCSRQMPLARMTDPVPLKDQDAADDEEVDFGDFEEETECAEDRNSDLKPHPVGSSLPHGHSKQAQITPSTTRPRIDMEVVAFEVDMSLLDRLIPQSHSANLPPDMEGDIISSTSSRKTWYRISRKETVREHNSGVGDYVRVTWVGSSIQASVSKTVARWITEDRIAGGVVFGGGNRLGAMFGWGEDARGVRKMAEQPQVWPRLGRNDSPPPGPWVKTLSLKVSPPRVTPQSNGSSAIDSPVEDSINVGASETNSPVPQFGWSTYGQGAKRLALDTPWSATSAHQKAIPVMSMPTQVPPVRSLSPLNAVSYPSLRSRPASLDLSGRKTSESLHTRGSKSISSPPGPRDLRISSSPRPAMQVANRGVSSVNGNGQRAAKVELDIPGEQCSPRAPADLPVIDNRLPTQITQLKSLSPRELATLDIRKPNKDAAEDEIVDRAIKGLPNLAYMLR